MDRILIAEDTPEFRQIFVEVVRSVFPTADIWTAKDGREAYQKFKTWKADAVITDLMMPEVNGERLAARIREGTYNSQVPIILVSSTPHAVRDKSLFDGIFCKSDIRTAVESLKQSDGGANVHSF